LAWHWRLRENSLKEKVNVPEVLRFPQCKDRAYLEEYVFSGNVPAWKIQRATILLKYDYGEGGLNWSYQTVCGAFDINAVTVTNFHKAFSGGGLEKALNR